MTAGLQPVKTHTRKRTMIKTIKKIIYLSFLYNLLRPIKQNIDLMKWKFSGRPLPLPTLLKQNVIIEYARRYTLDILVETGTYLGDTVYATMGFFTKTISIELDRDLFEAANRRFSKYPHVTILWGDSESAMYRLLPDIRQTCLFWLDAHYSGGLTARGVSESPIIQELSLIFDRGVSGDVVLIDDARCFTGLCSYPTIEYLKEFVSKKRPDWQVNVKDDIIRLHKRTNASQL